MKISVIIPAYNAENTIKECINSLLHQTLKCFEIIVVDDGSTDNTAKIIKSFGKKVKLISQKNSGPASARNNGAKKAKGNIIVFTDSDCVADKKFLKELTKHFAKPEIVGVQGSYKTKQTQLTALFDQCDIETRYEKMKRQEFIDFVGSYAAAYKKSVFLKFNGFDENFKTASGEDPELSFRLFKAGKKMIFAPKAIVYHKHPESVLKYLKTKFYRGFWRVLLYNKHPDKKTNDSYTSAGTLYGTLLASFLTIDLILVFCGLVLLIFNKTNLTYLIATVSFALIIIFSNYLIERNLISKCKKTKIPLWFVLTIIPTKSVSQFLGILKGYIHFKILKAVKK